MYKRILIPVDFSEAVEKSLNHACRLASSESQITLIHVVREIEALQDEEDRDFYKRLVDLATPKMERLAKRAQAMDLNVSTCIQRGREAAVILGYVNEHQSDLIIMSSTPLSSDNRLAGLDSLSHTVAMLAQCPVFLIK